MGVPGEGRVSAILDELGHTLKGFVLGARLVFVEHQCPIVRTSYGRYVLGILMVVDDLGHRHRSASCRVYGGHSILGCLWRIEVIGELLPPSGGDEGLDVFGKAVILLPYKRYRQE